MKTLKSARTLAVCLALPFAAVAATSVLAEEKNDDGGVVEGAAKGAVIGAVVPGVSAGTGAAVGATVGGVKKLKNNNEEENKE